MRMRLLRSVRSSLRFLRALAALCLCVLSSARLLSAAEVVENSAYRGPKTTIKYALWGGANEVSYSRKICRDFVKKYPRLRLEVAVYPWGQYWAKLQTQAAAGLAPDVMSLYSGNMGVWIARGALLPLDGLVKRSRLRLADFHQPAVANCTWNGRLYCLPIEIPARTLIYSQDRLEEAGIPREKWPRPDRPLSWDEFVALARQLTLRGPDGSFSQYGMAASPSWNYSMLRMHGGDFLDRPVNPTRATVRGNAALAQGIIDIFRTQYGHRFTLGYLPLSSGAFVSADTILLSPKFAMSMTGPWALPTLKRAGVRFGLTPMPRGARASVLIDVNAVGIYAHSRQAAAAWDFIRFMASPAVQPLFGRSLKGVPALIAARDSLIHNDYGIKGCEAFLTDLEIASPNVMTADSYVPHALNKWLTQTEQRLDQEYDRRRRALPRRAGRISPRDHAALAQGMDAFVAQTVRRRLPELQAELEKALGRTRPVEPGWLVLNVIPVLAIALLAALLGAYVRWIASRHGAGKLGRRPANAAGYLCISPWLIGCFCFSLGPIIAAVALSFTRWNMISPPQWVGALHYAGLAADDSFLIGLRRTFMYALLVIPISLAGGLFTAGLLTCNIRGRDAFKAIFYFPSLFTGAAAATLWVNMFNKEYGVVNRLLAFVGASPINWLDETHAFYTVVLMNVFWIGGAMIIYYAGMKQIPAALYEAAEVDGAGPLRRFLHITIPMLSPVILFMVVMTTIGAFQVFTPALFFASSSTAIGEPGDALRFYSVNIYDEAFNNLRMGRACCQALILFVIIFAVTMIQMKLSRRFVHTEVES